MTEHSAFNTPSLWKNSNKNLRSLLQAREPLWTDLPWCSCAYLWCGWRDERRCRETLHRWSSPHRRWCTSRPRWSSKPWSGTEGERVSNLNRWWTSTSLSFSIWKFFTSKRHTKQQSLHEWILNCHFWNDLGDQRRRKYYSTNNFYKHWITNQVETEAEFRDHKLASAASRSVSTLQSVAAAPALTSRTWRSKRERFFRPRRSRFPSWFSGWKRSFRCRRHHRPRIKLRQAEKGLRDPWDLKSSHQKDLSNLQPS